MKFKIQEKNMSPYLRCGRRSGAQGEAARVGESALAASISGLPASVSGYQGRIRMGGAG